MSWLSPVQLVELAPRGVERRDAGIAAAGQVDGRQVERQAQQVVAQRLGLELVDLVADLAGGAAHDGPGCLLGRERAALVECQRVEEGLDQREGRVVLEGGVEAVDLIDQHRVAEAVDHVRELGQDRRIDLRGEALRRQERVDVRLYLARELLEHQVLVLHLGAELGGLEQALAVPHECIDLPLRCRERRQLSIRHQPLVQERHVARGQRHLLGVLDQAVVLGVEHVVDGCQTDVLVDPPVAGHEVLAEQLVVVGVGIVVIDTGVRVGVGRQQRPRLAVERIGRMGDVSQERVAGADRVRQVDRRQWVALDQLRPVVLGADDAIVPGSPHHDLREAAVAPDEVAVGVGRQQRHVANVGIREVDAEDVARLGLQHRPGGHAAEQTSSPLPKMPSTRASSGSGTAN